MTDPQHLRAILAARKPTIPDHLPARQLAVVALSYLDTVGVGDE